MVSPEHPPRIKEALRCGDEHHRREDPREERDVGREHENEYAEHYRLEALGERAPEVEAALGFPLGLESFEGARQCEEDGSVQIIGEEEDGEGEAGAFVLYGEGDEEASVYDEIRGDIKESPELRAFASQPGDLPVEAVEEAVCEPERERGEVEPERDEDEAKESECEADDAHGVGAHVFCEGGGEGLVEGFRALPEFLVEHAGIIVPRFRGRKVFDSEAANRESHISIRD